MKLGNNRQRFYLKRNETDCYMIEFYTKAGSATYLAAVIHEDMLSDMWSFYGDTESLDDFFEEGVVAYLVLSETEDKL